MPGLGMEQPPPGRRIGRSISRDLNAALNILKRALALLATEGLEWSLQAITVGRYSSEQSRAVA